MEERWLPVVGHDGYEVSDLGRVRSVDRWVTFKDGRRPVWRTGQLLTQTQNAKGYRFLNLGRNAGPPRLVHRLVMEAFVGPCPPDMEVLHGPAGGAVNQLDNLSYGTRSQNARDQLRDGTNHARNKRTCPIGHLLQGPNLVRADLEQGKRHCLACSRARTNVRNARVRNGIVLDFGTEATRHYAAIMGDAAAA